MRGYAKKIAAAITEPETGRAWPSEKVFTGSCNMKTTEPKAKATRSATVAAHTG